MISPRWPITAVLLALVVSASMIGCSSPPDGESFLTVDNLRIRSIERRPADSELDGGVPFGTVLFLHGAAYDAEVWDRTGALDSLASAGFFAAAIDLPGFGESEGPAVGDADKARFVDALLEHYRPQTGPLVLVSPSMSGEYTFSYLDAAASREADIDRDVTVDGIVFVAPVRGNSFERSEETSAVPVLAIVGENDAGFAGDTNDRLAQQFDTGRAVTIDGAGHAAYEDQPEEFNDLVVAFASGLAEG